jgi:hypothetical protein
MLNVQRDKAMAKAARGARRPERTQHHFDIA